jgi:hypothetical protein
MGEVCEKVFWEGELRGEAFIRTAIRGDTDGEDELFDIWTE